MPAEFAIPEIVRRRALNLGEVGRDWLAGLDADIASLASEWGIQLGAVLDGGTEAFVAEATTSEGRSAILKIGIPGSASGRTEARVLEVAAGRGYAELFRHDAPRRAMLLERLGPRLADLGLTVDDQIKAICETLLTAWRPPPADSSFINGAEKAESLATFIADLWVSLEGPCSRAVVDRARIFAERRRSAYSFATSVLAHGDAHENNTLLVADSVPQAFKFIDPGGLVIEPAYDLAISMRGWSRSFMDGDALTLGHERAEQLAALTGVPPQPIWEWGLIERVSTGLLLKQLGQEAWATEVLAVAEIWATDTAGQG